MNYREFNETEWKEEAVKQQKFFYHSYGNQWFQAYNPQNDRLLLRAKVNFSLFGKPKEDELKTIEEAYDEKQNSASEQIVKQIYEAHRKIVGSGDKLCVSIIFILCYENEKVFRQPLYAVKGEGETVYFIDTMGRTYKSWTNFKDNNKWNPMDICIPLNGYYSCSPDGFKYDEEANVQVEFTVTPAKRKSHKLVGDGAAAVNGLGAGVLAVASMLTPMGWGVAAAATYASVGGMGATSYGCERSAYQIVDKALHDEDMLSLDSFVLYGSLALTPLAYSFFVTWRLNRQVTRGSIGSKSLRSVVTFRNSFALNRTIIAVSFIILLDKNEKEELTALDVMQFSMSVFFFTHTLIQPTTVNQVIERIQAERFQSFSQNLSEGDVRAAFERFVENNRGDIKKDSHIIRTINRMDNPEAFFTTNRDATMTLGGRKGKTVFVTDSNGVTNRINPNRVIQTEGYEPFVLKNRNRIRIEGALGEDIKTFEVGSNKIFQNASKYELRMLNAKITRQNANPDIVNVAKTLCEDLNENTASSFISMLEIVSAHVKEGNTAALLADLLGPGRADFLRELKADYAEANRLAGEAKLSFKSVLDAVYHFRKHGKDFPSMISNIECYLNIAPEMYKDAHLIRTHNMQDGRIRKFYLKPNDTFMVVEETREGVDIASIYIRPGERHQYLQDLSDQSSSKTGYSDGLLRWDFVVCQFTKLKKDFLFSMVDMDLTHQMIWISKIVWMISLTQNCYTIIKYLKILKNYQ